MQKKIIARKKNFLDNFLYFSIFLVFDFININIFLTNITDIYIYPLKL
jgi:hypothetical protein